MDVQRLALDRTKARELYQKYKTHQHYETDQDREIKRTYQLIAQGKVIIQALDAIKRAGLDSKGLPRIALAGATAKNCWIRRRADGSMVMQDHEFTTWDRRRKRQPIHSYPQNSFEFGVDTFGTWIDRASGKTYRSSDSTHKSAVPIIPIHLRPKRGLQSYHVLWEAEWEPVPTRDPYLLRRIGKADLWLVCAAWDLTDVERAAMATRIAVN